MQLARPFWIDNPERRQPLLALGGVVVLSLMTTGVSVVFNFLGRDFFNALSAKDEATFYVQLGKYLSGFAIGIPVFVFRDYFLVCPGFPRLAFKRSPFVLASHRTYAVHCSGALLHRKSTAARSLQSDPPPRCITLHSPGRTQPHP